MPGTGRVRWSFNVREWEPTEQEWKEALTYLSEAERESIRQYRRSPKEVGRKNMQAKATVAGRLMLRRMISIETLLSFGEIEINTTTEGKPYMTNIAAMFPNFNFNLAHRGDWTVLVSEPYYIVGVDIMEVVLQPEKPIMDETVEEFFSCFENIFTRREWNHINKQEDPKEKLRHFYVFWCLKECYLKAIGVSLGFDLLKLEFEIEDEPVLSADSRYFAHMWLEGVDCSETWSFICGPIDEKHVFATVRGMPKAAIPSYYHTMRISQTVTVNDNNPIDHEALDPEFMRLDNSDLLGIW
eukprot:TRINITY_DN20894_c0_g1_i1.p1 TRINITY_DN20894_c0_g1~~TRINITY_DN20894_c0_g1_i1.p1  ORF type:complete len:311 (-),score=20.54 TRINITY_DN20894_c0_g1_i1:205-1098(-)